MNCFTPPPIAKYCDERVCLCVCSFAITSSELHVRSRTYLPMAVDRASAGGLVICYALPVLLMTSYLLIAKVA